MRLKMILRDSIVVIVVMFGAVCVLHWVGF